MSDLVEITVPLLRDYGHVLCVSRSGDAEDAKFLRKREIVGFEPTGLGQVFVVLPRQLARERSLL